MYDDLQKGKDKEKRRHEFSSVFSIFLSFFSFSSVPVFNTVPPISQKYFVNADLW